MPLHLGIATKLLFIAHCYLYHPFSLVQFLFKILKYVIEVVHQLKVFNIYRKLHYKWPGCLTELQFQLVFKMLFHSTHESRDRMCLAIQCVCLLQKCHLKALQKRGHLSPKCPLKFLTRMNPQKRVSGPTYLELLSCR